MLPATDTISAIATPPGEGGIGIVRVSGAQAFEIARKLFHPLPSKVQSHRIYVGTVVDPDTGEHIRPRAVAHLPSARAATRAKMWWSSAVTGERCCCAVC
jgi:tRNA modification GTPase